MPKMNYRIFEEARFFSRGLRLSSVSKWKEFCRSSSRPANIPFYPNRIYKNEGWISWMDWLGTKNKQGGNRKYSVKDDYFKTWSSNMAYILGFWFTDGYINEKTNLFSITQHKRDKYILESFLKELESNYPLSRHGENNFSFRIISEEIVKDIVVLGGCQRKSYCIKFPDVPKLYLPDFVRGLWDGDGSISFYNKKPCSFVSSFVGASKEFIETFVCVLRDEIPDFRGTINKITNNDFCTSINVGINDTRRLRDYMYGNLQKYSLFLERKRDRFMKSGELKVTNFVSYNEAKLLAVEHGITTGDEWKVKYKKISVDLPANPDAYYKEEWTGWKNFLDTKYWDFEKAKLFMHSLKFKNVYEWREYSRTSRAKNIPSNPWSVYPEWIGIRDWLGV